MNQQCQELAEARKNYASESEKVREMRLKLICNKPRLH